jgi:hypothetical protein
VKYHAPTAGVRPWDVDQTPITAGSALGAESAVIRSLGDLSALQDWIDAGAKGTFVADCRITSSVCAPWLTEWINANRAAKAAVAG